MVMKLKILLFFLKVVLLQSKDNQEKLPNLYNLPGYDTPAEFSDDDHKDQILKDIERFDHLPPFEKKKYHELNHTDPQVGIEITRQILSRGKQRKFDFFELPDTITNSEFYRKQAPIDFEGQYDNRTGKFHKQFKNQQMNEVMRSLHINDANKEIANFKRQESFIQNEAQQFLKRPEYLKKDTGTSLLQMSENDKAATLVHLWEFLAPFNCWASSRWELAFIFACAELAQMEFVFMMPIPIMILIPMGDICMIYWFMGYPCFTGIGNKFNPFAWLSEKLNDDAQNAVVTFKTEFDTIRRVKFHMILFMTMPDNVKIEMTEDLNTWWTAREEFKTIDLGPLWFFWWLYYHEYPAFTYAKSVKIIMKGIRNNFHQNRHGIWMLMFFSQQHTVQIMEKTSEGWPRCVARAETGYFQTEKPFLLLNCLDAILQNDSREVFFLDSLYVKQWVDNMCLTGSPKTAGKPMNFITSQKCEMSDHFKYVIDRVGKFINKAAPAKCFAVKDDDNIKNVQTYGYVKTSGDLSDSRVNPYDVIDPSAHGWWAAPNYAKNATWELHFDRKYFIEEIIIQFKYRPKTVTINILNEEMQWVTYLHKNNCTDEILMNICPMHVLALQIQFLEKNPDQVDFNVPVFGLSKVICKRPGSPLSLQTCAYQGSDSKIMNRFKMEFIDYVDTSFLVPHKAARAYMINVYMTAKKAVEVFILKIPYYHFINRAAQYLKKCIIMANNKVDEIYSKLHYYKRYKLPTKIAVGSSSSAGASCYACSQITAASGCDMVKKRKDFRKNGFFWIKSKCMPAAQRVFCDFETGEGNFYLYWGHLKDKKKTIDANDPDKIIEICKKQGLEPVEIKSAQQFESLIEFVNQVGANSEDEYSIPFAYKWDFKLLTEKFQSLNGKSSKECTAFAKKVMEEQTLIDKLQTIGSDLLVLKKSKNKLSKTFISKEKIRGVICSENQEMKEKKDSQKEVKCSTNLGEVGSVKQGTIVKIQCPIDCGKANIAVYGGPKFYHKESSICRAAIHAGSIVDADGGEVELKVVKGQEEYNGIIENNIESERKEGSLNDDCFQIVKKPLEKKCPNLKPKSFISFSDIIHKVQQQKQSLSNKDKSSFLQVTELSMKMPIGGKAADMLDKTDYEYAGSGDAYDQKKAKAFVDIQLDKRYDFYEKYLQFTKDSEKLMQDQINILKGYEKTDLAPDFQEKQLETILIKYDASQIAFKDETLRYQSMIINMKKMVSDYYQDLAYLKRFEIHWEQYEFLFNDIYDTIDGKKAKGDPSNWSFTREDVLPHAQAIQQQSPISCGQIFDQPKGDCTGTMSILRFKKFFDFTMELDFKVRKMGFFGFIFRYKDEFNYYSIDLSQNQVQFRRMMDGEQTIIQTKEIDRILSDKWYNIQLTAIQSKITFKMGQEIIAVNPQKYNYLKTTLQNEDAFFKKGLTGLFTDGTYGFYVDNFAVKHLDCQKETVKEQKVIEYQQPQSSRFREIYLADINQIWTQNSQESARWEYKQNSFGRKKALQKQLSATEKSKSPMILENKQLRKGTIQFDMYLKQKTSELIFVFYYESDRNYYGLVINKSKVLIIQMFNGKRQIVKKQERKDISNDKWYTIYFQISDYELDIQFEEALISDRTRIPLFDQIVERPQTRAHKLGFSLDKGIAAIDNIMLYPGKIPQPGKIPKAPSPPNPSPPVVEESPGQSKNFLGPYFTSDESTDDSDDSDGNNDNNNKQQDPVVANVLDKIFNPTFDYKQCLNTTVSMQEKYCEIKSNGLPGPKSDCKQNYCSYCCEAQVSKKNIQEKCIEECQHTKPEKDKIYYQCFDSAKPQNSAQSICNMLFTKKTDLSQQKKCKTDLCNLCCITTPIQYSKGLVKESLDDCYQMCSNKFDI